MRGSGASHGVLRGTVQVDGVDLGGTGGRGSENKVPFIGAVSLNDQDHPLGAKLTPLPGFTRAAIADWTAENLALAITVISDGLACFTSAAPTSRPSPGRARLVDEWLTACRMPFVYRFCDCATTPASLPRGYVRAEACR